MELRNKRTPLPFPLPFRRGEGRELERQFPLTLTLSLMERESLRWSGGRFVLTPALSVRAGLAIGERGLLRGRRPPSLANSRLTALIKITIRITIKIKRKSKMAGQGKEDGAEVGEEFFGGEAEMPISRGKEDEGATKARDEHGYRMKE